MADVSVIIPCYNCAAFIGATIQSALDQTDPPEEIIVVDDGSTDDSGKVVTDIAGRSGGRVRLIQQPNAGVSRARNTAIDQSHGKYIAFLDADDLWLPEKTTMQVAKLEQDHRAVGTHTRYFDFETEIDDLNREETVDTRDNPSLKDVVTTPCIMTSTAMIRRSALGEIRFDETTGHSEDMILFAELRLKGRWRLVDDAVVAKRKRADQASSSNWHRVWAVETRMKWLRDHIGEVGEDLVCEIEAEQVRGLAEFLERIYWRRDLTDFKAMRRRARAISPTVFDQTFIASAKVFPRWVYKLRDKMKRGA